MKLAHNYNPDTGVYIDSTPADLDELETAKGEGDVYLLPANATFAEPPTPPEGMVVVYDPQVAGWSLVVAGAEPTAPDQDVPDLAAQIAGAVFGVDQDVDATIFAVIGNRAAEYLQAEQEAAAYADAVRAGYPDHPVPPSVASDMLAFGHTAMEAAESILAMAAAWRGAGNSMRAQRLKAKQEMRLAGDVETLAFLVQEWRVFIAGMRQALGV